MNQWDDAGGNAQRLCSKLTPKIQEIPWSKSGESCRAVIHTKTARHLFPHAAGTISKEFRQSHSHRSLSDVHYKEQTPTAKP